MNLKYLIVVFVIILSIKGYAQISSDAIFSEATEYSDSDFVFVFCTDDVNGGSLTVKDSTGNGGYNFAWYKFNEVGEDFTDALGSGTVEPGDSISTITGLGSGGYMVTLTNASPVQTYVAWVYIANELTSNLRFDDGNECDFLGIWYDPVYTTNTYFNTSFNYYDTVANTYVNLKNKMASYDWGSDNNDLEFTSYNSPFLSLIDLPTKNTTFNITATDRFGCQIENDIYYTAIETRAKLLWEHIDDKTGELLESGTHENAITGPAPLYAKFTNDSENGQDYVWFLGDTLWAGDIDTIFTSDYLEAPEHIYYYVVDSGYTLKLISESSYGCKDSVTLRINVEPSKIEFPNVFSPNDDGVNDFFELTEDDYQSIRDFKITIFNRVGQVVHEYEGDIRDWEGWKGNVRDSNRDAPAGTYFVVFEVKGWDNVKYNNDNPGIASSGDQSTGDGEGSKSTTVGILRLYR